MAKKVSKPKSGRTCADRWNQWLEKAGDCREDGVASEGGQAELVEHLLTNIPEERIGDIRDKLMIDLSPISYQRTHSTPCPMEPPGT